MPTRLGTEPQTKQTLRISDNCINKSILALGMSGSGKTNFLFNQEAELAASREAVLVFDRAGSHQTFENKNARRWHVHDEGFPFDFFKPIRRPDGSIEDLDDVIDSIVDVFDDVKKLGRAQKRTLWNAVKSVMVQREEDPSIDCLQRLAKTLDSCDTDPAWAVLGNLRPVLTHLKIVHPAEPIIRRGSIFILDLSGYSDSAQAMITELGLSAILRYFRIWGQDALATLYVVCDEFQGISLASGAILPQLLREGRKYNLAMLLATQTLEDFNKARQALINQVGTKLYFRQTLQEARELGKLIECNDRTGIPFNLSSLKCGECIASGLFTLGGLEIDRPVKIKTPLYSEKGGCSSEDPFSGEFWPEGLLGG